MELPSDVDMVETNQDYDLDDVFMEEPQDRSNVIADLLKWSYALRLKPIMHDVAEKHCHGCYIDHPSQSEHDVCLMMPFEELVDTWFEEGLENIDEDEVLGSWLSNLGHITPTIRYHEISKYLDPAYRLEECRDETWMRDVKEKLISLHQTIFSQ